ncbi:MAG: hemolysin family protein [Lachnospiraceae bacterium]|nr:hemolysin family protein [Lachnospiraceae bacterium]MCI7596640.1 hemolysin family protein [Lachnospiraceae bacterium]MDD7050207.1 hemolysin family protein [Lachnospiraceae bacterium]MDY3224039.1 hemolysin family protein [Lachnospiraceae bacterium]MDY4096173.1 hemolysin family protein [Lachnospiraceae bacterium]
MDDDGPTANAIMVVILVLLVELCLYIIAKLVKQYLAKNKDGSDTEEEIISMVHEGHEQGLIQASEAKMITNIFEFGDKQAQDIMTHRSNIVAITGESTLDEAIRFMLQQRHSRYPVYEENIDHILGILHLKDALRMQYKGQNRNEPVGRIPGLLREAKFIPETRKVDALFRTMQSTKLQMVVVVDEYGQTSGLIAMEDILEEIVGSIMDEYDEEEEHIAQTSKDQYVIEGLTPLKELEERFGILFHEEEFETLNGFLIAKMDKIPGPQDEFNIDVDGYNFKVLSTANNRIQSVLVTKSDKDKEVQEESRENTAGND